MSAPTTRPGHRVGASLAALAIVGLFVPPVNAVASVAPAAEGDVDVVNTETVQVYTDASGKVQTKRVYEQLTMTGDGTVDLQNPVETNGLRNLDGFGGFEVADGDQLVQTDVDGVERFRTVSEYDGDLPLEVSVQYILDGKEVDPGEVVGEDGQLEVIYTVRNATAEQVEVTYTDGSGGTVTETVEVPVPMVGSLSTTAPANFTDVQSEQANLAGDGKGGTKMSFTMTLFPPLGSDETQFGYTAEITDGVVPRADISALPVNPLDSPTFQTAAESYEGGSQTGEELAAGATLIDGNLLKLRDGSADLLAGLIQLRDGSSALATGLTEEAAPGSVRLADGTGRLLEGTDDLTAGTDELDDGAGRLADGAGRLADGTERARDGGTKLTDGLKRIRGGLDQLSDVSGLPAAQDGVKQLRDGVDLIISRVGSVNDPQTLIGGLAALEQGLSAAETGSGDITSGLQVLVGNVPAESPGIKGAKGGVDQIKARLDTALAQPGGSLAQLQGGLQLVKTNFCATHPAKPQCDAALDQLIAGAAQSRTDLGAASAGLGQVSAGLGGAITGLEGRLIPGSQTLTAGITRASDGSTTLKNGAVELRGGLEEVRGGLTDLYDGLATAVSGVLQLADGAETAVDGSSDLASGLGELDDGAGELSAGAGELAAGTGKLDAGAGDLNDGAAQLDDGANDLADGLADAADGSTRLSDGLQEAAGGAPQLVEGATRLSDEGTQQLIAAGEETAQEYGQLYATIAAGAERADAEKMAYGSPEGSQGLTAYTFVLQGEDGESGRNLARGLATLVVGGLGLGAFALRRRLI